MNSKEALEYIKMLRQYRPERKEVYINPIMHDKLRDAGISLDMVRVMWNFPERDCHPITNEILDEE